MGTNVHQVLSTSVQVHPYELLRLPRLHAGASAAAFCQCASRSCALGAGGGQAGAYGSAQGVRDLLGGLWSTVAVQAPCAAERLAILRQGYPQLAALLPAGLMALSLVKLAAGQPWEAEEVCTSAPDQGNCRALLSMQARCCCVSAGVLLMDHTVAKVGAVLWR